MRAKILVVEDDLSIRQTVVEELRSQGWSVEQAMDGELGLELALEKKFDCIILDLMLPRVHGYEICLNLRREGKTVPVIMISALGAERDVLKGFELGATDFIRKPFSLSELIMRVKVQVGNVEERSISFSGYTLNTGSNIITKPDDSNSLLTQKESGVLFCLVQKRGQVLSRHAILNEVWGNHWTLGERSVDRCVKTLRKKLLYSSETHSPLKTIRQVGYTWEK